MGLQIAMHMSHGPEGLQGGEAGRKGHVGTEGDESREKHCRRSSKRIQQKGGLRNGQE